MNMTRTPTATINRLSVMTDKDTCKEPLSHKFSIYRAAALILRLLAFHFVCFIYINHEIYQKTYTFPAFL